MKLKLLLLYIIHITYRNIQMTEMLKSQSETSMVLATRSFARDEKPTMYVRATFPDHRRRMYQSNCIDRVATKLVRVILDVFHTQGSHVQMGNLLSVCIQFL